MNLLLSSGRDIGGKFKRSLWPVDSEYRVHYMPLSYNRIQIMPYDLHTNWSRKGIFLKKR